MMLCPPVFFFNDTATTEIYTLSLHDALPIFADGDVPARGRCGGPPDGPHGRVTGPRPRPRVRVRVDRGHPARDRKSTRLNSSHANISYAVFCLKKKQVRSALLAIKHSNSEKA